MFAKIENGQITRYPIVNIRQELPGISFPALIMQEHLPDGYVLVEPLVPPQYNIDTHKLVPFDVRQTDGKWVTGYEVEPLTEPELQERVEVRSAEIRAERNRLLSASDWTQVADAPVDRAVWAQYRQALRDITAQPGFPMSVDWPSPP